jgi:hypothetical protein
MYLDYLAEYKANELTRAAAQHRLARTAQNSGGSLPLSAAPINAFGQALRTLGTRITHFIPTREPAVQPVCVECPA